MSTIYLVCVNNPKVTRAFHTRFDFLMLPPVVSQGSVSSLRPFLFVNTGHNIGFGPASDYDNSIALYGFCVRFIIYMSLINLTHTYDSLQTFAIVSFFSLYFVASDSPVFNIILFFFSNFNTLLLSFKKICMKSLNTWPWIED